MNFSQYSEHGAAVDASLMHSTPGTAAALRSGNGPRPSMKPIAVAGQLQPLTGSKGTRSSAF